jgi:hypothetical protein
VDGISDSVRVTSESTVARRDGRRQLTRLDKEDADTKADLNIAYRMMLSWAREAELRTLPTISESVWLCAAS